MTIAEFDHLDTKTKKELLQQCCGSTAWVNKMLGEPPFEDLVELEETAEEKWWACTEADWREAFMHHPKIGDINSLMEKFAGTAPWAAGEQAGVSDASEETIKALAEGNDAYEKKFGFIFIVCATGKSAGEMLGMLNARISNNLQEELENAADEQLKIIKLRLEKLFT